VGGCCGGTARGPPTRLAPCSPSVPPPQRPAAQGAQTETWSGPRTRERSAIAAAQARAPPLREPARLLLRRLLCGWACHAAASAPRRARAPGRVPPGLARCCRAPMPVRVWRRKRGTRTAGWTGGRRARRGTRRGRDTAGWSLFAGQAATWRRRRSARAVGQCDKLQCSVSASGRVLLEVHGTLKDYEKSY
jgi:hypothetical protein